MGRIPDDAAIGAALLALAEARGPGRSFCPSEAARAVSDDWRPLMPDMRRLAAALQTQGLLVATQKGRPVLADRASGPIRLALATGQMRAPR